MKDRIEPKELIELAQVGRAFAEGTESVLALFDAPSTSPYQRTQIIRHARSRLRERLEVGSTEVAVVHQPNVIYLFPSYYEQRFAAASDGAWQDAANPTDVFVLASLPPGIQVRLSDGGPRMRLNIVADAQSSGRKLEVKWATPTHSDIVDLEIRADGTSKPIFVPKVEGADKLNPHSLAVEGDLLSLSDLQAACREQGARLAIVVRMVD